MSHKKICFRRYGYIKAWISRYELDWFHLIFRKRLIFLRKKAYLSQLIAKSWINVFHLFVLNFALLYGDRRNLEDFQQPAVAFILLAPLFVYVAHLWFLRYCLDSNPEFCHSKRARYHPPNIASQLPKLGSPLKLAPIPFLVDCIDIGACSCSMNSYKLADHTKCYITQINARIVDKEELDLIAELKLS